MAPIEIASPARLGGTIILLRGLSREAGHWGDFPDRLREATGLPVATLDLPGCGSELSRASPASVDAIAADVRARAELPLGPLHWLGLSLGGLVALRLALDLPERSASLCLINASIGGLSGPLSRFGPVGMGLATREWLWRVGGCHPKKMQSLERAIFDGTCAREAQRERTAHAWEEIRAARPVSAFNAFSQLRAAARFRLPKDLGGLPPTLAMCSWGDRLVAPDCSQKIARSLGSSLAIHSWGGHDLPTDDPGWVAARWTRFATSQQGDSICGAERE